MIPNDFSGMSDRDILISVATRQQLLSEDFVKFTDAQGDCNRNIEERVRDLEVYGSKVSKDIAVSVMVIDRRLTKVEKTCLTTDTVISTKKSWIDTIYVKIGIIAGIIFGFLAFLKDVIW